MSFRELSAFTETMRTLGYEHPISVESFRTPNIVLVCECIYWLVRRYEPSAEISFEIGHESDRIDFFKRICETVLSKSRIRLNAKKLYQADGYAVQEMMKLAGLLKEAALLKKEDEVDYNHLQSQVAQRNLQDAKKARTLCTELTGDGSNLYFMLDDERATRPQRERVISRATEISEFERRLRELLQSVASQVESLQEQLTNLSSDESNLEQKIESKKTQLERAQKRLNSLLGVKPAFMEEYQKYESELNFLFVTYLEQYRNLEYLEHVLAKLNKVEDELLAEQEAKLIAMREKIRKEELTVLRGADFVDGAMMDGDGSPLNVSGGAGGGGGAEAAAARAAALNAQRAEFSRGDLKRPRAASGRQRPPDSSGAAGAGGAGGAQAFGSLASGKIEIDNDDDDDDDSDLIDDDDDETDDDEDDDDGEASGDTDDSDAHRLRLSDSDED